jgi:hypothetical protein
VRQSRQQDLVEVPQYVRERLTALRGRRWEPLPDVSWIDLRQHRQLADSLEVTRGPLERGGAVLTEAHFSSFSICGHVRVFNTCSFVSHARRA